MCADDIIAANNRSDRAAIIGIRYQILSLRRIERERVHEISVAALRPQGQAVDQWMWARDIEGVPAHMRDLQRGIARHNAIDFAADPAEPVDHFIFASTLGQQLHADANAEEWPALAAHRLLERLHHAGHSIKSAATIGESPYSRQDNAIGARHDVRIARHDDGLIRRPWPRNANCLSHNRQSRRSPMRSRFRK